MRQALTAAERLLLADERVGFKARLEVRDGDGTWRDASNLEGEDFFDDADWGGAADDETVGATFSLRRSSGEISIAPLIGGSPVNQNAADAYDPPIREDRPVRLYTAAFDPDVGPVTGDWHRVYDGKIAEVDSAAGKQKIVIRCRDLGAYLQEAWVETEQIYGADGGRAYALVLQDMLDDWAPGGTPALVTIGDPNAFAGKFKQSPMPLLQAMREFAARINWVVRFEWGAGDTPELQFFEAVEKATPDAIFGPGELLAVTELKTSDADIRNTVQVRGFNSGQHPILATATDGASILKYRRRWMAIQEDNKSPLNTVPELQALATAAVTALSTPYASHRVETLYFWPVMRGDKHRYLANALHYDSNQELYVVAFQHTIRNGEWRTTMLCRGKPIARYYQWFSKAAEAAGINPSTVPPAIHVRMISSTPQSVTYEVTGDTTDGQDVSLYYGYGDDPVTTVLANPGNVVVPRSTNASDDRLLRLKAVAANGLEVEQVVVVDYDTEPEVKLAGREPLFSGTDQIGWRLRGAVDDDCRAFVVQISGDATIQSTSPAGANYAFGPLPGWYAATDINKVFSIDLLQAPGQSAVVTITPVEFFNATTPGLIGKAAVIELERAPITTAVVRPYSTTTKIVTLESQPTTAIKYYTLDGGTPQQYTGPFTVDVGSADVVVSFWAVSATGAQEAVKRIVLDEDPQPEIASITMSEEGANNLRVTVGLDEDVVHWRAWLRRGAAPLNPVTGEPDEKYKRYDGGPEKTSFDMRASGNGDGTSTWFCIVRAYDDHGDYAQRPAPANPLVYTEGQTKKLITGPGAPAVGSLSNVVVQRVTHAGQDYHDLIWNHNQAVQDTLHTVTIRENGVELVNTRDARTEHDGASAVSLVGGYHTPKTFANPGDPGAEFRTYNYQIDLKLGASVLATYSGSVSGWYAGGGGGGGSPPGPPVPNTPAASTVLHVGVKAVWTNTQALAIRLVWEISSSSSGPADEPDAEFELPAGTTNHQFALENGKYARARLCYYNADGDGGFSGFSGWVISGDTPGLP